MRTKAIHPAFRTALAQRGWTEAGPNHMSSPVGLSHREAKHEANRAWHEAGVPLPEVQLLPCGCCWGRVGGVS